MHEVAENDALADRAREGCPLPATRRHARRLTGSDARDENVEVLGDHGGLVRLRVEDQVQDYRRRRADDHDDGRFEPASHGDRDRRSAADRGDAARPNRTPRGKLREPA